MTQPLTERGEPTITRAIVVPEAGAAPRLVEIALPVLGRSSVRVRITAAGVCHSDLSLINGTLNSAFPVVPGHEATGIVIEVGPDVSGVSIGARVVLNWAPACRTCWFCHRKEPWLCTAVEGTIATDSGLRLGGAPIYSGFSVGAFADEVVLDQAAVVPIPDWVPSEVAALLGCAVLTGCGAVLNSGAVNPGDSALVIGLGGIGMSAVLAAALIGCDPLIVVDLSSEKGRRALESGATHFLQGDVDALAKRVRGLTEGRGVDHAFECVGNSTTIRTAWSAVRRGGRCTIVGVGGRDQPVEFNALELFHFARTLTSSIYGYSDPTRDIPRLLEHIADQTLRLSTLITERIELADVPAAFDRLRRGVGVRSVIILDPS